MLNKKLLFGLLIFLLMIGARSKIYPVIQLTSSYLLYPIIYLHHQLIDPLKTHDVTPLQTAYDDLLAAHIQLQATIDFHDDIKEVVAFKERYNDQHAILAQILERYAGQDEQYLILDKGSRDGVHDHMVLVYKDMLVGRVHQLFPLYCKCLLVTDERCKIAAYSAQTKAQGVAKGCNRTDLMELEHVSHLSTMQQGDLIISSGDGLIFPRGFGIARIVDFYKDDLLYHVSCRPLIDPDALHYCYLIEKS